MVRHTNHDMEATFYEDQYSVNNQMENMKGRLRIDLHDPRQLGKQFTRHLAPVLSSPDVNKLGITTPDFEKFLMQNGSFSISTPTPGLFPIDNITEEQERFGQGFDKALQELKHGDNGGIMYDLDGSHGYPPSVIKEEPQTVPSASTSPAMSPVDMESQERMKLERKRMRNREAASKCRRRKLERISKLEDKVKLLKVENSDLATKVNKLKAHVFRLKEQVIEHVNSGCAIEQPFC